MRILGCFVLLALALTGCSDGGTSHPSAHPPAGHPTAATAHPEAPRAVAPTWRRRLDVVGQPEVVGRTAVVVARARGDDLDIVGLDLDTGRQRWRYPFSPGDVPTGYGISPEVVTSTRGQKYVVFQQPTRHVTATSGWVDPIVAVDPASGTVRLRTRAVEILEPLTDCADGHDACAVSGTPGGVFRTLRVDLSHRALRPDRSGVPAWARALGSHGLFATDDRPDEQMGRVAGGHVLWEQPVTLVMGSGYSSDGGWEWRYHARHHLYVGYLGRFDLARVAAYGRGDRLRQDLHDRWLVGLDARTGALLWKKRGREFDCAPGADGSEADVRCDLNGTAITQRGHRARIHGLRVTVEGYRPATGRTTWRVALSRAWASRVVHGRHGPISNDGSTMVVGTRHGLRRLSTATGRLTTIDPHDRFVCESAITKVRYAIHPETGGRFLGGRLRYLCDARSHREAGRFTDQAIRAGAVTAADGWYLLSTATGVSAYHLPTVHRE